MISKDITIKVPASASLQPAAILVQVANQFNSSVRIEVEDKQVNAKSLMGMLSLTFYPGESIKVITQGEDETQAMERIEHYLTTAQKN